MNQTTADLESAILGELLLDQKKHEEITSLKPEHFESELLGKAFREAIALAEKGMLDLIALRAKVENLGLTGLHISSWIDCTESAYHIKAHAAELVERYQRRQIVQACTRIIEEGNTKKIEDLKEDLTKALDSLETTELKAKSTKEVIASNRDKDKFMPISTGYARLDRLLGGGFSRQAMITVAAVTSVGKSQFSLNMLSKAKVNGKPIRSLYISQEMGDVEIQYRVVAAISGIPINICRTLYLGYASNNTKKEFGQAYEAALKKFEALPMYIYADGSITAAQFKELVIKYRNEIDIVCLDYLQQVKQSDYRQGTIERINEISRTCKQVATRYNIPVIAVAQLNRNAQTEDRPKLYHLKESSQIEQDSDYVIMLHREKAENVDQEPMEVILNKNRHGMLGNLTYQYLLYTGQILDFNEFK